MCRRHLLWAFETSTKPVDGGWNEEYWPSGKAAESYYFNGTSFSLGVRNHMKLIEYTEAFPDEKEFVYRLMGERTDSWLTSLVEVSQEPISKLFRNVRSQATLNQLL
jgi:hypothetical protein